MPADAVIARATDPDLDVVAGLLARSTGEVIGEAWLSVSQAEEDAFAALIGDWDPMHNDPAWHQSGGDGPIVLGFHVLARLEHHVACWAPIGDHGLTVTTVGLDRVRFPSPLPVGATARVEVVLDEVTRAGDGVVVRTRQQCTVEGAPRPTMVAEHLAFLSTFDGRGRARALGTSRAVGGSPTRVDDVGSGPPVPPATAHDGRYFEALAALRGRWFGPTEWTSISDREAHAFALLCGESGGREGTVADRAHPFSSGPLPRLHLLSLRAYFSPQVGLPVLTDDSMMAYNYGVDSARWFGDVGAGTPVRDRVQLRDVESRRPGDHLVTTRHVVEAAGSPDPLLVADCKTLYRANSGPTTE